MNAPLFRWQRMRAIELSEAPTPGISLAKSALCRRTMRLLRWAAWWHLHQDGRSFNWLGPRWGTDHSTVSHGVRRIAELAKTCPDARAALDRMKSA